MLTKQLCRRFLSSSMPPTLVQVEVVSDTVCPWCYVGRKRFTKAQATLKNRGLDLTYEIVYKPFYLDPSLPQEGVNKKQYYGAKFGMNRFEAMTQRMAQVGAQEGIAFDDNGVVANTLNSHRLILFGKKKGKQLELVDRLFKYSFEEKGNVGDLEGLAKCAGDIGLDQAEALAYLKTDEDREFTFKEIQKAMSSRGIQGVPHYTFTVNGRKAEVSGAQSPEVFTEVVEDLVEG